MSNLWYKIASDTPSWVSELNNDPAIGRFHNAPALRHIYNPSLYLNHIHKGFETLKGENLSTLMYHRTDYCHHCEKHASDILKEGSVYNRNDNRIIYGKHGIYGDGGLVGIGCGILKHDNSGPAMFLHTQGLGSWLHGTEAQQSPLRSNGSEYNPETGSHFELKSTISQIRKSSLHIPAQTHYGWEHECLRCGNLYNGLFDGPLAEENGCLNPDASSCIKNRVNHHLSPSPNVGQNVGWKF